MLVTFVSKKVKANRWFWVEKKLWGRKNKLGAYKNGNKFVLRVRWMNQTQVA